MAWIPTTRCFFPISRGLTSRSSLLQSGALVRPADSASVPRRTTSLFGGFHGKMKETSAALAIAQSAGNSHRERFSWTAFSAVALGGVAAISWRDGAVHCELKPNEMPSLRSYAAPDFPVEEPKSIVNAYQLSFGAICGICAGVFIKKGLKLIAFFLGGGFILLQYLSQHRLVTVDWKKIGSQYNSALEASAGGSPDSRAGGWNKSTAARIYSRFADFLTANFQERATLLAGLALGLRLG